MPGTRRTRKLVLAGAAAVAVAGAAFATTMVASAATSPSCRVRYTVSNETTASFNAKITVTNLGDTVTPWTLKWSYTGGQHVTGGSGATFTQTGTEASATSSNRSERLRTNRSRTLRVSATKSTTNPSPTSFTLNGASCSTGNATATPSAAGSKTASAAASTQPSAKPSATASASSSAKPSATATSSATSSGSWNPPSTLVSPLAQVWSHEESTYGNLYNFKNYGWDQLIANNGSINYCVRWDSTATVTSTQRDQIQTAIQRQVKHWMDQMVENGAGWNGFPYTSVPVKVVGWAVRDRSQLQWTDSSVDVYVNDIYEDAPECSQPCGRFFNQGGSYPNCPGGASHHYDMSLWLTSGFGGGAGGDWGQRVGSEYFMGAINSDNIHIVEHELGHTFGLDDFYDWTPSGVGGFIMNAGSATQVTEFDQWMLRDWWRHLKSRYGY